MVSFLPKFWFQGRRLENPVFASPLAYRLRLLGYPSLWFTVRHYVVWGFVCFIFYKVLYFYKIYINCMFKLKTKIHLGGWGGAWKEKIKLLTSKAKLFLRCIQVTGKLGLFQTSKGTSKLQATMCMFVLIQLKSPMIIRCFLFVPGSSMQSGVTYLQVWLEPPRVLVHTGISGSNCASTGSCCISGSFPDTSYTNRPLRAPGLQEGPYRNIFKEKEMVFERNVDWKFEACKMKKINTSNTKDIIIIIILVLKRFCFDFSRFCIKLSSKHMNLF